MELEDISRQRIDYRWNGPDELVAIATVTLADGSTHRFEATIDGPELRSIGDALAASGDIAGERVEGLFGSIGKALSKAAKAVVHTAKKVVASKVLDVAAKGLALAAPVLGPAAPMALGAAAALGVAHKLGTAAVAAEHGAKKAAQALTRSAVSDAKRLTKGNKAATVSLLRTANKKRKQLHAVAEKATPKAKHPIRLDAAMLKRAAKKPAPAPAAAPLAKVKKAPTASQLLAAAARGKLKSNKAGSVNSAELAKAAKAGRVFWLAA